MNHDTERRIQLLHNAAGKTTMLSILLLIAVGGAGFNLYTILMDATDGVLNRYYNIGPFNLPFMGVRLNQAHFTVIIAVLMVLIPLVFLISLLFKNSYMKRNNIPSTGTFWILILSSIVAILTSLSIIQKFLRGMTNYTQIALSPTRIGIIVVSLIAIILSILAVIDIKKASKLPDYVPTKRARPGYFDPDEFIEERDDVKYAQESKDNPEFENTADLTDVLPVNSNTSIFEPLPVNENGNIVVETDSEPKIKTALIDEVDVSAASELTNTEENVSDSNVVIPVTYDVTEEVVEKAEIIEEKAAIIPELPASIAETITHKKYLELPGEDKVIIITREYNGEELISETTEIVDKNSL